MRNFAMFDTNLIQEVNFQKFCKFNLNKLKIYEDLISFESYLCEYRQYLKFKSSLTNKFSLRYNNYTKQFQTGNIMGAKRDLTT